MGKYSIIFEMIYLVIYSRKLTQKLTKNKIMFWTFFRPKIVLKKKRLLKDIKTNKQKMYYI